ncbi:ProQ/FinO family protein [Rhizobium sp. BK176]|uniref:ProQ/FinO family protein n=1 Tax=Rhizobium sp. BK176 TaxID=2587071 RepID=UPI00216A6ADE|nr:ProQ/FinO family protein [Rhizobium sp. BK176]MCS4089088.1 sRNA-binding protein [Rhizobium sp. BK176]
MGRNVSEEQREKVRVLSVLLSEQYPGAFPPGRVALVPLKIGIHRDVMVRHPEIDRLTVKNFFVFHAYSKPYLQASSVAGSARRDLDGNEAGIVTEEQAQAARDALAKIGKRKKKTAS